MNVPKLRFGEFEGEWQETTIGSIAEVTTGNKDTQNRVDDGTYPFFVRSQTVERINSFAYDGEAILTSGDGVGVGKNFHYINGKFDFHQRVYCIYKFRLKIYGKFVYSYFSEKFNQRVMQLSAKNSVDSVRRTMVTEMPINLPYYEEQQKIADFLSAVDEKITALTAQKTALTQYKQGMMQRIFSQTLRFKNDNGADYPEWEVKYLKNVSAIYDGTHMTPDYQASGVPFYSVEHVTSDNFNDTKFISAEVFEKECKRVKIEKNDILMTRIGDIGTSKLIDWDVKASFYVSLALIKPFTTTVGAYLNQYIRSSYFQRELYQRTIHVAFPKKINLGEIGECVVKLPNFDEQTKIAQLLTELDDKINAVDAQIQSAQQWKQGLLQQMFV